MRKGAGDGRARRRRRARRARAESGSKGRVVALAAILAASIAIFGGSAAELAAQQPAQAGSGDGPEAVRGVVEGVITAEGVGQPGVTVELVELGLKRVTDARGRYEFGSVPPGRYTLRFSRLGLAVREEPVVVESGRVVVDVALSVEAIRMSPVHVLSGRTRLVGDYVDVERVPGSAQVLDRSELRQQGLVFDDANSALRQVPGVYVQEEEGYGLRPNIGLRGTGTDRSSKITVMEDGVPVAPAPYSAPAAYYFPVVGRMEAIEVRKGSAQIQSGPWTTGGALNLVSTSIPRESLVEVDAAGGSDRTGRVVARIGDSGRNFGWLLETYQAGTEGYKKLDGGGDTGFRVNDYLAKLRLNTDLGAAGTYQEVELKLGYYDQRSDETYLGLTDEDFAASPLRRYAASAMDRMDAEHRQAQLRYFVKPSRALDFTAVVYRNEFARSWYKLQSVHSRGLGAVLADPARYASELAVLRGADSDPGALVVRSNDREYLSQGVQGTLGLTFEAGAWHDVELGVRLHMDEEDRFQHDDAYQMVGGRMVRTHAGAPGSQSNRVSDARAVAVYVQDRMDFGRLAVTPGLRFESIRFTRTDYAGDDPERRNPVARENEADVLIPGLGASFQAGSGVWLFGGVHRGFGPPGPGADQAAKPESSVNYELGGRLVLDRVAAQVVGFYGDYDNMLGAETLSGGGDGQGELHNAGAVRVRGVEASAEYDPLAGRGLGVRLPLRASYTYTQGEFLTSFQSAFAQWGTVTAGDRLPYLPEHQVHAGAGLEAENWAVRLVGNYTGALRTQAGRGKIPDEHRTDAALVLNLSAEYGLQPWGTVYGAIQNLTDSRHVVSRHPAGVRPGLPRTLQIGLRVTR